MKGTKSLIKELQSITEKIDNEINELEQEINRLDNELQKKEGGFSVKTIEANKELNEKKKIYKNALNQAREHKKFIMINNTDETVKRASRLIKDYKKQVNEEAQDDNEKVKSLVAEIQKMYEDMKQRDHEAREEINNFVKEIEPYLDDTPKKEYMRFGANQPAVDMLQRTIDNYTDLSNKFTVIKGFNEHNYRISGLFPPAKKV